MNDTKTLEVTTYLYGLGSERKAPPVFIALVDRPATARSLVAEHVCAEVERAQTTRNASLALHYILADDLRHNPTPAAPTLDAEAEIARAHAGLAARRYMLLVDGQPIDDLDAPLALHERSLVNFVRLLPLVGG